MINSSARNDPVLDREGDLPLYVQLREVLRQDIRDRGLRPGDRLPTEDDLERRYGVSRSTIRQAMGDLAAEGVVRRFQGRGTFVGTPKIQHTPVLASFSELLRSQGYTPSHRLLESAVVPAPATVAEGLEVDDGTPCRYLQRLFFADRLRVRNLSSNTVRLTAAALVYRDASGALKLAHSGNYDYPTWEIRPGSALR